MSEQPSTRQELYDRIKESSKDEVILNEMIRLGFWPEQGSIPEDPADEVRKRTELEKQLRALRTEHSRLNNEDAIKRELRKRRMEESRRKQQETKERRIKEKAERAEKWKQRKEKDILYLGHGKSAGLNNSDCDDEKLRQSGLPVLNNIEAITQAMGLTVNDLRFLAFSREVSTISHYIRFTIPKKTGGHRLISAPMPRLKEAQYWILRNILEKLQVHDAVHGFCISKSIVTNASPHLKSEWVINLDLQDFFPTIIYKRVKGLFKSFGYSESTATIFALICTEPEIEAVKLDGKTYYVSQGERFLPQGAPTSPAISNLICRRMDKRLQRIASEFNLIYTRYADDITFSSSHNNVNIGKLLRQINYIVDTENFTIHKDKTRVMRKSRRLEVTGIVVNEKLNITRKTLKRFRALLYQIEKDGPEGKSWGESINVMASIKGFANYVSMVNPDKGLTLKGKVRQLIDKYGYTNKK